MRVAGGYNGKTARITEFFGQIPMLRALVILILLAVPASAQQSPRLTATISRTGYLVVLSAADPTPILVVRPAVAGSDTRPVPGRAAGSATLLAGTTSAAVPFQLEAAIPAGSDNRSIRVRCRFGDDNTTALPPLQVGVALPVENWIKARATRGDQDTLVPESARKPILLESGPGDIQLIRQGTAVRVGSDVYSVSLVDKRTTGRPELEIQFDSASATTTELVEFTIRLPGPVRIVREEPLTLQEGDDWVPMETNATVAPGGILDFSTRTGNRATPANGRLVASPDGHLTTETGKRPIRVWGVHLSGDACFPTPGEAESLALRIGQTGYNAVRLEGVDEHIDEPGNLEKFDALLAALRKAEFWTATSLHSRRPVAGYNPQSFKFALLLRESARENWKEYCRKILLRPIPGTGKPWKDDPSLAFLSVCDSIDWDRDIVQIDGKLQDELTGAWNTWCQGKGVSPRALPTTLTEDADASLVNAFLQDLESKAFAKMDAFLRKELGVRAIVTGFGAARTDRYAVLSRANEPVVERRFTWDGPVFLAQPNRPPVGSSDDGRSMIGIPTAGPMGIAMDRMFGKPMLVTGHGTSTLNPWRFEESVLTATMAGLQDWDALFSEQWAGSASNSLASQPLRFNEIALDPVRLATERIAALIFLRRDQSSAPQALSDVVAAADLSTPTRDPVNTGFPEMAWVTRVGRRLNGTANPLPPVSVNELRLVGANSAVAIDRLLEENRLPAANKTNLETDSRHSETNQVFIDGAMGTFRLITPRTIVGIAPDSETLRFGAVSAKFTDSDGMFWITALDNQPIAKSARMLVAHVTDAQNSGSRFYSSERKVLEEQGTAPTLARHGLLTLELERSGAPRSVEIWRLDQSGQRTSPVVTTVSSNLVRFTGDNRGPDGKAVVYYEIIVRDAAAPQPLQKPAKPKKR